MMSKMKKWIACLVAALLVFQAVPAFMEDGEYVSNVMVGSLAGFRDLMEIISEGGSYMLTGETVTLTTNEDYTPNWSSSNPEVAEIVGSSEATHSITVKAVGFGETTITAISGEQTKVLTLTVINPESIAEETAKGEEATEGAETAEGENTEEAAAKTKAVIVINGETLNTRFTGEEQRFGGYTATSNFEDFDSSKIQLTREIEVSGTECGYYQMKLTENDFRYDDENVKAIFIVNDGYMKITPAKVTVQADNKEKTQGTEDPELTATVTGTIGEDTLEYTLTRDEGEEVDTYRITVTGEELQGNYRINYVNGFMNIIPAEETAEVKDTPKMSIHVTSSWPEDEPAPDGTEITYTATLYGFENMELNKDYTLQWQYLDHQGNWVDEEGATGITFTYRMSEEYSGRTWRVIAKAVEK